MDPNGYPPGINMGFSSSVIQSQSVGSGSQYYPQTTSQPRRLFPFSGQTYGASGRKLTLPVPRTTNQDRVSAEEAISRLLAPPSGRRRKATPLMVPTGRKARRIGLTKETKRLSDFEHHLQQVHERMVSVDQCLRNGICAQPSMNYSKPFDTASSMLSSQPATAAQSPIPNIFRQPGNSAIDEPEEETFFVNPKYADLFRRTPFAQIGQCLPHIPKDTMASKESTHIAASPRRDIMDILRPNRTKNVNENRGSPHPFTQLPGIRLDRTAPSDGNFLLTNSQSYPQLSQSFSQSDPLPVAHNLSNDYNNNGSPWSTGSVTAFDNDDSP